MAALYLTSMRESLAHIADDRPIYRTLFASEPGAFPHRARGGPTTEGSAGTMRSCSAGCPSQTLSEVTARRENPGML